MKLQPVRLEPQFVPRIWGARTLWPLFPDKDSLPEPIGEVWLTGNECRFANGPFAGEKLGEAWPRMPEEWTGRAASSQGKRSAFPLLSKFLFPEDKLSVQVHPDDGYARQHEAAAGGSGKTEMWYVISARPGAEVRVGLKPEVTKEKFRRAIADGTAENCVERVPVKDGDAIFVPAGTVHTIGPGMILCEIQQNSDITYRVFDYNRRTPEGAARELHVERAIDVIRFGKRLGGKVTSKARRESSEGIDASVLVECPYFTVVKSVFHAKENLAPSRETFELIIVIEGHGRIEFPGGALEYATAQAWLLPAHLRDCRWVPEKTTTILGAFTPSEIRK